jgi:hypothetical protein
MSNVYKSEYVSMWTHRVYTFFLELLCERAYVRASVCTRKVPCGL